MGSPGRNLNIPEQLRAWHEAGLHYVLRTAVAADSAENTSQTIHNDQAAINTDNGPAVHPDSAFVSKAEAGSSSAPHGRPEVPASAADQLSCDSQQISSPETPPTGAGDYRNWPEPWCSLWLKTPHDPKIIWTYFDLGLHMGGRPDPEVGRLLQSLIYYFRWPKGTIAFWPMSERTGDQCRPNPEMFWQGHDLLGVRHVAVFGSGVLSVIAPDAPSHANVVRVGDTTIYRLPSLAKLAPMLPHERLIALQSVKQLPF